jgi:hypothetical protein
MNSNDSDGSGDNKICYVCGKVVGDHWFARFKLGGTRICVCSPRCGMLYSEVSQPAPGQERTKYYQDQEVQLKAARAATGELASYDAYMGQAGH